MSLGDLTPRIKELRSEEDRLINALTAARDATTRNKAAKIEIGQVLAQFRDLKGLLESGSPTQRKQFVSALASEVTKTGDAVSIEYTLPVDEVKNLDPDKDGVPRIDLNGGPDRVRTCDRSVMSRLL